MYSKAELRILGGDGIPLLSGFHLSGDVPQARESPCTDGSHVAGTARARGSPCTDGSHVAGTRVTPDSQDGIIHSVDSTLHYTDTLRPATCGLNPPIRLFYNLFIPKYHFL